MKASAIYKKFIITSVLSGSFLVFGGIYQGMSVTSNSFMEKKEISFEKRVDENSDRIVASSDRDSVAVQYLPVAEYSQVINGKWEVVRIEDHEGLEIYNEVKSNNKRIVDMELIGTGLVRLNENDDYTFDVSFLHENKKNISIFRAFEDGFELIEARKIVEKVVVEQTSQEIVDEALVEEEVVATTQDRREFVIERAILPSMNNKMFRGHDIDGSVTVGPNGVEGLFFTVYANGQEINEVVGDLKLKDGNSFEVELQGQKSSGIFSKNGENGYRLRFATGPYQGALINYVTYDELEKINIEFEKMERAKEESRFQKELTQEGNVEQDINIIQQNVVSAAYQAPKAEEIEEERYEEEYQDERYDEEEYYEGEDNQEFERQGYGF
ncbi:hypothetical protein BALOs_3001 [Halobacteriovorax sp. BALOs_7]|uniref:DUF4367 domain-containing protein n=1 Tax=Halobacteriovorax vibrionivorans TaxID=2152716 RepID=A0ABY0IJ61_9BACT|nr:MULTISPECIES: hypothetical protein [Halobacteriovorax]AYF45983.1 hypothetical protein BALOs_3001 [Halobacteriovorax sp. BALOs_7]RZF23009.1 hypothetical protein DAY19_04355 [Halobacteriovorax vibrionivorans]TGD45696.1 hypothetical protein EP118_14900 [Halobacteriovorax sp. Y22]